ncbi:cell elongation-specific peptidoglycan D,D-transpeptidase [Plantibacter flavus]|nr:penicillin-binding protein 2 [Plantibacter flavus]SMG28311.1 cell elongation-specific peptidoglycan D,D-transpeptidase [Plantibacter flavus]
MQKEVSRVGVVTAAMFVALFAAVSSIQVLQVDELNASPLNSRTALTQLEAPRGRILVGGVPIAESVPSEDPYRHQRVYTAGPVYAPVTGYLSILPSATGVERAYGSELTGEGESQWVRRLERVFSGGDVMTNDVELTLDSTVQQAAYDALTDRGLTGSVVAMEPSTGRILAMVSTPSYDPGALAGHDPDAVSATYADLEADPAEPLVNRALGGSLNPPGSVFKLVTASAALESGEYDPESLFANPARIGLPGSESVVRNATGLACGPGDEVTLARAIAQSCNVPFVQLGPALGESTLRAMAEAYGFDRNIEIPLDVTPSSMRDGMSEAQVALSAFGQDDVRATPLQIAMVSAAIANRGVLMTPRLVDAVIDPVNGRSSPTEPSIFSRPISPSTSAALTEMMLTGVTSGAAMNAAIRGVDVAGKTGTAENGPDDPFSLWFTGFAPAHAPRIAITVLIEDGGGRGQAGSGSEIAAPIAREVLEAAGISS